MLQQAEAELAAAPQQEISSFLLMKTHALRTTKRKQWLAGSI